ncbi:MAG: hypothetical protein AAFQ82_23405, partial [Myxococcota bacterium]
MRWNGFMSSLVFGAVVAALYQPALMLLGPVVGYREAALAYVIVAGASYAAGLVNEPRRGLVGAFWVGSLCTVSAVLTQSPPMVALAAMGALGVARSTLFYAQPVGRAALIEAGLFFASGLLGSYLIRQGAWGGAIAVWGVFL